MNRAARLSAERAHEWERRMALPEAPINPARLQGPDAGAVVIYHSRHDGDLPAVVVARSYVWAPDQTYTKDGTEYRGIRRYDLKVITYAGPTGTLRRILVDDADLTPTIKAIAS